MKKQTFTSKSRDRILFISPLDNDFIQNDFFILSKENIVTKRIYNWQIVENAPLHFLRQFIYLLFNITKNDKIIIEFAGYWSLLPSLFGKIFNIPVIVVCHGTDCASLPSLRYGSLNKRFLKTFCKLTYKLADLICPVSDSLIKTKNIFHKNKKEEQQGILAFIPNLKTPFKVIHNGLDIDFWQSENNEKKKNSFLSVFSENQFYLKGGDIILKIASKLPNYSFEIAGTEKPLHINDIPKNLTFLGKLEKEKLKEKYQNTEFYFQLSTFEGFGLSLCEAMLNECIPIGSSSNMISEIIGNSGYILETKDEQELENIIKIAVINQNKAKLAKMASKSIAERFSLKKREIELLKAVKDIT